MDRTLIQSAFDQTFPPYLIILGAPDDPSMWLSETAAVQAVLQVANVIVTRLSAHQQVPAADRWQAVTGLVSQVVVTAANRRQAPMTDLPTFEATVRAALAACAWWQAPAVERAPSASTAASGKTFGQQLQQLRTEARWTVDDLVEQVRFNRTAVLKHLSGRTHKPRPGTVHAYETAFSARLNRSVKFDV